MRLAILNVALPKAEVEAARLREVYGDCAPEDCDVIVALGGDGFMLDVAHKFLHLSKPIFGINYGAVGFLMNSVRDQELRERLERSVRSTMQPLEMVATAPDGSKRNAIAINEVSLLRTTPQASKMRIKVDGRVRLEELICDGVLLATPAGSTAYNLSANGPILPLDAPLLALTPITAFRPRRWKGALLPQKVPVTFEVLDHEKRPAAVAADSKSFSNAVAVDVRVSQDIQVHLLFDEHHGLEERILAEQFSH